MRATERTPAGSGLALLAQAGYRRLWLIGGLGNAMRWLEPLAAGLFVLDVTGSALATALVTASRAMPLLLFGPAAGAIAEALDRRLLLIGGLALTTGSAAMVALLALAGTLSPGGLAALGFVSGVAAAGELSVRRRMIAESADEATISQAVAFDSITNAGTRMVGPLAGGALYAAMGVPGAYALSTALNAVALVLAFGVQHPRLRRRLRWATVSGTIREAVVIALGIPAVRAIVIVTVAMNCFGFSFTALLAPVGRSSFGASDLGIGLLAAAEPAGALAGAALLARRTAPAGLAAFFGGASTFLLLVALMPHVATLSVALLLLFVSGLGTAAFATVQTALVLEAAPPEARSRLMGLVTMAIGTGPLGMVLAGAAASLIGASWAVTALAALGLAVVAATAAPPLGRSRT